MSKARGPPRVVVDTNLVLFALVFAAGTPGVLRHVWQQARFQPLVSNPTAAELPRALAYPKFKLSPAEQEELLADYPALMRIGRHSQAAARNSALS